VKVQGTYTFEAPLETVWNALFDPEVLARTLPGCEKLEREGNQFKGDINVKMGPVQGKFQGKVDIIDIKERESYTMIVDGRGPAGFGKATALMRVQSQGTGTRLDYDSDVQVGGKIASVGQRLIDASSRAIVKQSLEGLHQQIRALAQPAAAGASGPGSARAPLQPVAEPVVVSAAAAPSAPSASPAAASPAAVSPAPVSPTAVPGMATAPHAAPAPSPDTAWFGAGKAKPASVAPAARPAVPVAAPGRPAGPSQASFVFGVAKEIAKEVLPLKMLLLIVAVVVLGWIIYRTVSGG
jgi:carbon monoxide dehydrogenase subunit G